MYKAVNVNESTYQELHKISTQLHRPKAKIVEMLVKEYVKTMNKRQIIKLAKFNKEMGIKIKALKLSKSLRINTDNLDEQFTSVIDSDRVK